MISFTVRGRGEFPRDMLRRDDARPADEQSAKAVEASYQNDEDDTGLREVRLDADVAYPTLGRWKSFGWPVVAGDGYEKPPEPWHVTVNLLAVETPRVSRNARATAQMDIERLDAGGPIIGALGSAVEEIVRQEPAMAGSQPYLMNGILGLFACMVAQIDKKIDGAFNDARSAIAWAPGWDIEILIN